MEYLLVLDEYSYYQLSDATLLAPNGTNLPVIYEYSDITSTAYTRTRITGTDSSTDTDSEPRSCAVGIS